MKDLDAIKARLEAAHIVDEYSENGDANLYTSEDRTIVWLGDYSPEPNAVIEIGGAANPDEIATFIEHAYNEDQRRLIARVEQLEAQAMANDRALDLLLEYKLRDFEKPEHYENHVLIYAEKARTALTEEDGA